MTADVSLTTAADGDVVAAVITAAPDISIPTATVVASWPLDSGARWTVDGIVAAQIQQNSVPVLTLAPDDGPIVAFDFTVPANGYLADQLAGIELVNLGTAVAADIAHLGLWYDGGDGNFDAGSGDDTSLGSFEWIDGSWYSSTLSTTIPLTGLRPYTAVTVATTPTDSATVQLGLPLGGIITTSGNSGPLDETIAALSTLVFSTSPILTSVEFASAASTVGQTTQVTMTVRNAGGEIINDITPLLAAVTTEGEGDLT